MTESTGKRAKHHRRSPQEMQHAVEEAKLLMARGYKEKTARYMVRLSKECFDKYSKIKPAKGGNGIEKIEAKHGLIPGKAWECPRCGRVNAPFMPWCDCKR